MTSFLDTSAAPRRCGYFLSFQSSHVSQPNTARAAAFGLIVWRVNENQRDAGCWARTSHSDCHAVEYLCSSV